VGARRGGSAKLTPAEVIVGTGRVRRGLGKEGGVLLVRAKASCFVEDTTRQMMGNCTIVSAIYCILRGLA